MKKEPLGLYLFRFVLGIGLLAFMCMLYWSSELIEERMSDVLGNLKQIDSTLVVLKKESEKMQAQIRDLNQALESNPTKITFGTSTSQNKNRPHMDTQYPNLLQEDLFYAITLPKMLGPNFKPSGVRHGATIGKPENLHPFSNWAEAASWQDQCNGNLATMQFGKYETMAPDFAIKIEERKIEGTDIPEFWVHLREGLFWQPLADSLFPESIVLAPHFLEKHPVTSADFKLYFDALMNPFFQEAGAVALRNYYGDMQEIRIIDDLTFVVRWKAEDVKETDGKVVPKVKYTARQMTGALKPLASFVYKYFSDGKKIIEDDADPETYRTNSVWAQNFTKHWAKNVIVSCGAWTFDGMTDRQINFKRNPDYYNPLAVLVEGQEIVFKNSPDGIWQDFKEGRLDSYSVQPSQQIEMEDFLKSEHYLKQAKNGLGIRSLEYLNRSYVYIGWNQARVFFKSAKARRAMTLAIDRQRIINQNMNGMGVEIHGTFFLKSPNTDPSISPWPFAPQEAKKLLQEEGWFDSDGDGILDKMIDGKKVSFRFTLTYYVKNTAIKAICDYVATALKEIGIDCKLQGVDLSDISAIFDDKNFDALCMLWSLGTPPEEPKQLWHSSGAQERGSSNFIGFANKEIDEIIEALRFEYNAEKRKELYHRFDQIIHQQEPYTFLFTPKINLLYREYLQNVFIPADRQDLIPGANVEQPQDSIFWIKK